jgi:hypothetical protein
VIKVVSEFRQVDGYPVSFTNKTDRHDITEILLKIASNTITVTLSLSKIQQILKISNIENFVTLKHIVFGYKIFDKDYFDFNYLFNNFRIFYI